jgi:hypothetical protein
MRLKGGRKVMKRAVVLLAVMLLAAFAFGDWYYRGEAARFAGFVVD